MPRRYRQQLRSCPSFIQSLEPRRLFSIETAAASFTPAVTNDVPGGQLSILGGDSIDDGRSVYVGRYGSDLYLRRFDANGQPTGSAVKINTNTNPVNEAPSIAFDTDRNIVVVWRTRTAQQGGDESLVGRTFYGDNSGTTGEYTIAAASNGTTYGDPSVDLETANGYAVVGWAASLSSGGSVVHLQRFSANSGGALGEAAIGVTLANTNTPHPRVATSAEGNAIAVAYEAVGTAGKREVRLLGYDDLNNNGFTNADKTIDNVVISGANATKISRSPDIVSLGTAGWGITWTQNVSTGASSDTMVNFRAYAYDGEARTGVRTVSGSGGIRTGPHLSVNAAGDYTVGWTYAAHGAVNTVTGFRSFDAAFNAVSTETNGVDNGGGSLTLIDVLPFGLGKFAELSDAIGIARVVPRQNVLELRGTSKDDSVSVTQADHDTRIRISMNGSANNYPRTAYARLKFDLLAGNDKFDGASDGKDSDTRLLLPAQLIGGDGNDTIAGGSGDDSITGDAGNDSLSGVDGNDYLVGGDGRDWLNGDAGDDNLVGGAGFNTLQGGDGDDRLVAGGKGNLHGEGGIDRLYGGDGDDTLDGGGGADRLYGNGGNDLLAGGGSIDRIYGGAGNDTLSGGSSDGPKADFLFGGPGTDTVSGRNDLEILDSIEIVS